MNLFMRVLALCALVTLIGCAHPISISPDMASVDRKDLGTRIPKSVGYYISAEDRAREVTTPGGGGDKVQYMPYRDLEPGLYKMLSNAFSEVHVLKSPDDKEFIRAQKIGFVLVPKIETTSSSSSLLTWPPTDFTVSLECRALNGDGTVVWNETVKGEGKAAFSEFVGDFSLAGRRASEKAILELQRAILSASALRR